MRPAIFYYYLAQTRTVDQHRPAQHDAPAPPAGRARPTQTPRRWHRVRGLPAVLTRRVLTVLGDRSP
jgi:hypothetical protein